MRALLKAAAAILGVAAAPTHHYDAYHAKMPSRTATERSAGAPEMRHHTGEG